MGINIGDIIVEGDDIYGKRVNVAARLEGLSRLSLLKTLSAAEILGFLTTVSRRNAFVRIRSALSD
jgi:class 3 adenylate cyclase